MTALIAASEGVGFAPLPWLVAMPLLTALVIGLLPTSRSEYHRIVALLGSTITGAMSIFVLYEFEKTEGLYQFVSERTLIQDLGINWAFGIDGISLFLVILTGVLFPIAIAAIDPHHDSKPYFIWLMLLMAGSMGAFMALDLMLFFFFFEIVLVPMYFLIGGWGHGNRVYAAMKFFLFTMAASALMLVGILALGFLSKDLAGSTTPIFDIRTLGELTSGLTDLQQRLIFLSFALAFAVKVPLFPLHTWLPDAHTEAPTAGSVILAGVMLKLGTYGFIRFGLFLFPAVAHDLRWIFLTLGVVGIVYGAAVATMQTDLKRLVAYSSVAHMGFIVIGIFAFNSQGLVGSVVQMVNHGLATGALFLLVGWIYERRHTREISELSGLQKPAPVLAGVFTLVMLASIGLPGLNGFVGEFLILLGAFSSARWWTVVAVTGVILAALYLLWAYQRVFHGEATGDNATMPDLTVAERLSILPLLVLIVFLGVFPKPMIERIEPSVDVLINRIEAVTSIDEPEPEAPAHPAGAADLTSAAEHAEEDAGHGDADDADHADDGAADNKEDGDTADHEEGQ